MGMGFQSLSVGKFPTMFQTLVDQGKVEKPMFAFYLSGSDDVDGELVLGGYDPNHFKVCVTVISVHFYVVMPSPI